MEEITFEEGMSRLSEITRSLEDGELPLEEQFALYKKGVELVRICNEKLDTVEKEVKILAEKDSEDEL